MRVCGGQTILVTLNEKNLILATDGDTIYKILSSIDKDEHIRMIIDYIKIKGIRLKTTKTVYDQLFERLKKEGKPTKSFHYLKGIFAIEEVDMLEENLSDQKSIVEYVNVCGGIYNICLLAETNYPDIKSNISQFNLELFYNLILTDSEFIRDLDAIKK